MSIKNAKPLFCDKLVEFTEKFPDYTLGEVFYSMFAQLSRRGIDIKGRAEIIQLNDNEMYSALSAAMSNETEEA
jgi:hypothetical protein